MRLASPGAASRGNDGSSDSQQAGLAIVTTSGILAASTELEVVDSCWKAHGAGANLEIPARLNALGMCYDPSVGSDDIRCDAGRQLCS